MLRDTPICKYKNRLAIATWPIRPSLLQLGLAPRRQQGDVLVRQTKVFVYVMEPSLQVSARRDAGRRTTA